MNMEDINKERNLIGLYQTTEENGYPWKTITKVKYKQKQLQKK